MSEDRTLLDFLLEQENPLLSLFGMIVALDLIVSDPEGIDEKDMVGAKAVASLARERIETIRQDWRAALECAKAAKAGS